MCVGIVKEQDSVMGVVGGGAAHATPMTCVVAGRDQAGPYVCHPACRANVVASCVASGVSLPLRHAHAACAVRFAVLPVGARFVAGKAVHDDNEVFAI